MIFSILTVQADDRILPVPEQCPEKIQGSGDLGVIIERATGSVLIINTSSKTIHCRIKGLGDLSHASVVFSRDARYAFVFGRDGGLSKIDILTGTLIKRIIQAGNSIGGAISRDGSLIAVSNYEPGGVKIFTSDSLQQMADIPATYQDQNGVSKQSKVVGLVDSGKQGFLFSLFDAGEIWQIDMAKTAKARIQRYPQVGKSPYDALITADGRYYIAGLFGEDGLAMLDLWYPEKGVQRLLTNYGKGQKKLPVYKMPHLEGWAMTDELAFLPAVGQHAVLVANKNHWKLQKTIAMHGQPVFAIASPDGRYVWVNFAFPDNDTLQIIDAKTLQIVKEMKPGKGVLHMEFSARGEQVWVSVRDKDQVIVYDTESFTELARLPVQKPSGIFFTHRAHQIGL